MLVVIHVITTLTKVRSNQLLMKKVIIAVLFLVCGNMLTGQSNNYKIKGIIEDTLGNAMIYSTVLLMEKSDSTMIDFTRTELDGSFQFKDVPSGKHLVKSSYIGFIPLTIDASSTGDNVDLGILQMTEMASELMEVVIKAAKAPIKMRGDTIEYDASTFKVPEGSTVEDLLKRLPGLEIESDGSILSDGKDVTEVTVDGKSFFGSDPKAATKNLPAEGISKVQVFDRKTEEEKITGATSESQEKTMNLELKDDFKSGGFGKVIAGVGTEDTREVKGNFNKFNEKIQFSIVGVGNNTGRNGLSWDDYQDFMGSQSFNFSSGTDYGFGGGGRFTVYLGGGGGGIESSIQSVFFNGGNNGGYPENYNGGVNFNYDHKKTKLSAVYYYNQVGLESRSSRVNDKFYPSFVQNEIRETLDEDVSRGHRVELELEQEIDTMHTVKVEFNGAYVDQDNDFNGNISRAENGLLRNRSEIDNKTRTNGYLTNGLILLRKKFKKKGRNMGLNFSYLNTELETDEDLSSITDFYNDASEVDSTSTILQRNKDEQQKDLFKANALFVEPLSKRYFIQSFYNFRNRIETGDRTVTDFINGEAQTNGFLSRSYENTLRFNRIGTSLRYSNEGINVSLGLAYQSYFLDGKLTFLNNSMPESTINRYFNNLIPNVNINFSPIRNSYVSIGYLKNVVEPEIDDLQPIVDNSNPIYIREGNPGLTPSEGHSFNAFLRRGYPLAGIRMSLNSSFTVYENQFSTEETVNDDLITTIRPINIEGGNKGSLRGSINFPIIKNKLTTRVRMLTSFNKRPAIVNQVENNTTSWTHSPFVKFSFTPNDVFSIYLEGQYRVTNTSYDIQSSQDQQTKKYSLGLEFNSKLFAGFYFNADFDYNRYENDRFNSSQEIPIINASIYKQFLKGNKGELRLSIYDALDENVGFSQGASGIGISQSTTQSLGRYVMLSFTYNIRGIKSSVRKKGWH